MGDDLLVALIQQLKSFQIKDVRLNFSLMEVLHHSKRGHQVSIKPEKTYLGDWDLNIIS